ncbi:MucBP domain-containing protein [Levilactobacillus namurensis]|uniref:MucBP domain-containing protein n=1 Tax=Levilactobacillus namurensis TaxID=380393 RepID=A0AAW8W7J0_9LACO|nr:MucBP domain-containing protein [Levilactobacillus namurensis]MDT7014850.1 MucBP domain-containing protein [Levilactobacillus namurensis]
MALLNWLRHLVTRPTSRPRHQRPLTRRTRQALPRPSTHAPVPPQPTEPPVPHQLAPEAVTPAAPTSPAPVTHAAPDATLVVRLVDQRDHPLQPALVLTGQLNAPVRLKIPEIPGYTLLDIQGFTQNFLSAYGLTTLVYQSIWGQPVTTYLIDYDTGQLLALPRTLRGKLRTPYQLTPPAVTGYHIFQAEGNQHGQFSDQSKRVLYFYRRDAWQTVQRVHQYVTLTADHDVYDLPAGTAYGYQFPATSLWRLFAIITLTDQSVWYNLGGNQWLAATDTQRHQHWSRVMALPPKVTIWTQRQTVHWTGHVDYVSQGRLTIYREPYGEVAGQLQNGDALDIRQSLTDDQGLVWYQVGPAAYINARYVRLNPQK